MIIPEVEPNKNIQIILKEICKEIVEKQRMKYRFKLS